MAADRAAQPASSSNPSAEEIVNCQLDDTDLLSVTVHHRDHGVYVIYVTGELDMLTAPPLESKLHELLATGPECLIIDLSQVSFLGSTGLSILITVRQSVIEHGITLQLSGTSRRAVAVPLRITELDHLFELLPAATDGH